VRRPPINSGVETNRIGAANSQLGWHPARLSAHHTQGQCGTRPASAVASRYVMDLSQDVHMPRFKALLLALPRKAMSTRSLDLRAGAEIILAVIKRLFKPEGRMRRSARFVRLAAKRGDFIRLLLQYDAGNVISPRKPRFPCHETGGGACILSDGGRARLILAREKL
jgi:hypothetical protein